MALKIKVKSDDQQLSLFDDILTKIKEVYGTMSIDEISEAIDYMSDAVYDAKRKRRELKRKQNEERIREEKRKKEAEEKHIREVTSMDLPLDWNNVFDTDKRTSGVHTDSISDALLMSLNTLGCVDIEYIASITSQEYKTVINALKGSIFQNPDTWDECFYKGYETADEYLSGNLMRKWKSATEASKKYNGYFDDNVKAIEKILPPTVATKDIYVTLGSPWLPTHIIDDFIEFLIGSHHMDQNRFMSNDEYNSYFGTRHDEVTGTWEIPVKSRYNYTRFSFKVDNTYGTNRINALHIIERTLNMKSLVVRDSVLCPTNKSGKKTVINETETMLAIEKQKLIINEFQKWVWKDENRKKELEAIFEEKYSCVSIRHFDGSFLEFPTMSKEVQLYPYQKNAVARILFSPNTLLAHDVGSGKTYIMVAAGMELRRMGMSKKNLYVVPNNIVGQWKSAFLTLYPDAKILVVEPKKFTPEKREKVLEDIRDNDYDAVIIAYSCFEMIPLSFEYYESKIEQQKEMIEEITKSRNKATSRLTRKRKELDKALESLRQSLDSFYETVYFDELGINTLFVDEAHNFKNVPIDTKITNVLGINSKGSEKCQDMMDKVCLIQKQNNGRGVIFATGTPITNSITDIFIMQKYLQSGELALLDLQNFDSWIGMFAEKKTEFEIDVDTSTYRIATRFAKFYNLPELTSLLASIADFHSVDENSGVPDFDGYNDVLIGKTPQLEIYLNQISDRASEVRYGIVPRHEDNMLKITTDGRKAALDLRLVDSSATFTFQSKVANCAENIFFIYQKTLLDKSTQLVFCDTSTPKKNFNIYDELSALLVNMGIPKEQIAYIHDATSEKKRNELFCNMRKGNIRILLGSTFKLGLGVNIQDKLIALHHLDVPWRPADMVQREGRILRQGNLNKQVYIYRYITEGSFDAYSWQLLETKQNFISKLLSGSLTERSGSDIGDTVLNYAEVKALAIGNPLIKERVETANELSRLLTIQRKNIETRQRLEKQLFEMPSKISHQQMCIDNCKFDMEHYEKSKVDYESIYKKKQYEEYRQNLRKRIFDAVTDNICKQQERTLMEYQGMKIVLPSNMLAEKLFVWLENKGRYYVEIGNTEIGCLIRIDNFLESFEKHLEKLEEGLLSLNTREADLRKELSKKESYCDKIDELKTKLDQLDEQLGVEKE